MNIGANKMYKYSLETKDTILCTNHYNQQIK